ncbi:MAG: hypothetical protein K0S27_1196 [Gammaproteobacteria bacterium]|jgi:opacity protein-like surface antigen|nr:hypothetical protein [Gammaproteobacteria bacterium]
MFKKIVIASTILAMSSSIAFANASPYVGAALGVITNTSTTANSFRGGPVDFFAGYGATINTNTYLGAEVFATPFTATISNSSLNAASIKTTYSYSASILPGVMFSDHTLGYVRAGVVKSHFSQVSQNKTGAQLGLGMQTNLTQDVDLRAEYVFSAYGKVSTAGSPRTDAFKLGLVYKFE